MSYLPVGVNRWVAIFLLLSIVDIFPSYRKAICYRQGASHLVLYRRIEKSKNQRIKDRQERDLNLDKPSPIGDRWLIFYR